MFEKNEAYTVSTDGLLTLFNTKENKITWKKQLPGRERENYKLRNMGKNLFTFSDERVAVFAPNGALIFEEPLEGTGKSVLEISNVGNLIESCFVRSDIVTVYDHLTKIGSFQIEDKSELPADFDQVFEPLELIHVEGRTLLTVRVGTDGD